ncbi:enoyl-CoA hydratase [Chryseomicrobium sp. FSL W7-1435]|uniref:enoyl-CoA hydratase n=1 Tax=Chryseomicrobium sp. FSL W7-1435 TaxID=2921704 RepID=UPI00315A36B5
MTYEALKIDLSGEVLTVTLNRPDALNSMNGQMIEELTTVFTELHHDTTSKIVVLQGEGRAFSAGGDIKAMLANDGSFEITDIMGKLEKLALAYYTLPKLTIAAVHGAAAGLGFSLVLASDFIVAEKSAKLAMNFIGIALVPDGGGHFFLKERVGIPKAKQIIWEGKMMTGEQAHEATLVDQVIEDGQLPFAVEQFTKKLTSSPVQAMLESKKILHNTKMEELKQVLSGEAAAQTAMRSAADHLEGIDAFVNKRKPQFNQ